MASDTVKARGTASSLDSRKGALLTFSFLSLVIPISLLFAGGVLCMGSLTFGLCILITPFPLVMCGWNLIALIKGLRIRIPDLSQIGLALTGLALAAFSVFIEAWLLIG